MNTKKVAGVAGLIMASTVFIGVTAVHAQDRAVEYKMDIASIERFNQTSREVGLPEMDVPSYEEWLKAKRENEAASSRPTSTSQQPSKQDLMRRWLNKGIRTADDRSSTVAEVEIMRRERLWIKSAQLLVDHRKEMEVAREWARQNGVAESAKLPDGSVMGLVGIRNGIPKYNVTFNAQAADTISVDELWPGGSTGLGLSGTNLLLGIWDGGDVQTNHYAFTSGGAARAIDQDGVSTLPIDPHPTAVAGVMAASGLGYTNARGMAYSTTMWTYDWDDDLESEMVSAYANDLHVSNHSYGRKAGWGYVNIGYVTNCWWGDIAISPNECHIFGLYYDDATNADAVAYGNPHSLTVWASGNDRDDAAPPAGTWYVTFSGTNAIWHSGARPNDYYENGYDTIPGVGVAKNLLCVGATYKIVGGYSGVSSVILAPFSNCGPTDDGRIKPDVVAAGVDHFTPFWHPSDPNTTTYYFTSSGDTNNPSWATGTSFSSPGVAGAVGLLVEQREQHEPSFPYLSSTLKAIVIHTADEAGTTGPDYRTGWGLVNAASAAQLAQADHDAGGKQYIAEVTVADGDYVERTVTATGGVPLKVTIAWTDPTGPAQPEQLDPTNLVLVNDFDLRVIGPGGVTNYPFILDPANPANTATTGDNFRDNVEQVVITNPTANADYVVRVTHKGNLVDDTGSNSVQALSMTFSGILEDSRPQTRVNEFLVDGTSELLGWPSVVGQNYQVQTCTNLLVQDWTNISPEISSTKTNTTWDSGTGTIRNTQVLPATRNKLGDAVQMKRIAHALLFSLICFMQSNVRAGMIVHFRPEEPIHMQSLTGKTYDFDLDFNGVIDFILRSDGATFDTVPQDQNSILSIPDAPPDLGAKILPLQAGYEIGSSPSSPAEWVDPSTTPMFSSCMDVGCIGLWLPQNGTHEGYFGVQFEIEDAMHYGWVYLDNTFAGLGGGDIIEWAYQSEAGVPIFAGAIPEPTTLTLFGAGVIALTLTRRKKRIR